MTACTRIWDGLVALASGKENEEAKLHLDGCPSCQARLAELTRAIQAMKRPEFDAPRDQIMMAVSLMPERQRQRFLATLLGSSLATAGARAALAESFQMTFQHDDVNLRLMYSKVDLGWEVMGRVPDQWVADSDEGEIQADGEGHFTLVVSELDQTGFLLRRGDVEIQIPSAREAWPGGSQ